MAANPPRAGKPALPEDLVDLPPHLVTAYYSVNPPDPDNIDQQVVFGTSGHRGSSLDGGAFNEAHILATTQAIVEYRAAQGTTGPLFIGRDTHGLSEPAWVSALEVLAANDVVAMIDSADRYTPDSSGQSCHPDVQPRAELRFGRRHRRDPRRTTRHATADSSTTRPTEDRPTPMPPKRLPSAPMRFFVVGWRT